MKIADDDVAQEKNEFFKSQSSRTSHIAFHYLMTLKNLWFSSCVRKLPMITGLTRRKKTF